MGTGSRVYVLNSILLKKHFWKSHPSLQYNFVLSYLWLMGLGAIASRTEVTENLTPLKPKVIISLF